MVTAKLLYKCWSWYSNLKKRQINPCNSDISLKLALIAQDLLELFLQKDGQQNI